MDAGFQSGFVLAVIIAAVLLAGRLGGASGLALRTAQVALGLTLVLVVFSGTSAFYGPADVWSVSDAGEIYGNFFDQSVLRASDVETIHLGLGILFVAFGVILLRGYKVMTPSLLLGGILLILLGSSGTGGQGVLGQVLPFYGGVFSEGVNSDISLMGDAGTTRQVVRFVVMLLGAGLLAVLIWHRWGSASGDSIPEKDTDPE